MPENKKPKKEWFRVKKKITNKTNTFFFVTTKGVKEKRNYDKSASDHYNWIETITKCTRNIKIKEQVKSEKRITKEQTCFHKNWFYRNKIHYSFSSSIHVEHKKKKNKEEKTAGAPHEYTLLLVRLEISRFFLFIPFHFSLNAFKLKSKQCVHMDALYLFISHPDGIELMIALLWAASVNEKKREMPKKNEKKKKKLLTTRLWDSRFLKLVIMKRRKKTLSTKYFKYASDRWISC